MVWIKTLSLVIGILRPSPVPSITRYVHRALADQAAVREMSKEDSPVGAIESTFPFVEVNRIAERESTGFGRRHHRPVYVMHKWWARRLGSVFRAILMYTLTETSRLRNLEPSEFWSIYSSGLDLHEKVVFDPMMGGGTTLVEALRLGCSVVGADINPVAWFVVKKEVEDIDPATLREMLVDLDRDMGVELRKYYDTRCPVCGGIAKGIYYFYCKEIRCPDCQHTVPLMHDFFLAKAPNGAGDVVICPRCWSLFKTESANSKAVCPECANVFVAKEVSYVVHQNFICPSGSCQPHKISRHIHEFGRPEERMYAVEFYCQRCNQTKKAQLQNGRGYKAADDADRALLKEASAEFQRTRGQLPIPDVRIPRGVETRRALGHGYEHFSDLFNSRQLLNLGKIYRWVLGIGDENLREFLILAFSNCLKYNNSFCKYNSTRGFITDIFRTHSYSPSMSPVEANCYDTPRGRGAFTAFVRLVVEGKEYCRRPFDRVFRGGRLDKVWSSSPIAGTLVTSFDDIQDGNRVLLQCGSSEQTVIPDNSVDAVITDPPYADNVMYSELSNFFYVWLRIALKDKYRFFAPELVPWEKEVISNSSQGKGREEFLDALTRIFRESNRVLREDGLLVFTFHHREAGAWAAILQAILNSGYQVQTVYPVRSEMRASTHLQGVENIKYDLVVVCRRRRETGQSQSWGKVKRLVRESSQRLIRELHRQGESLDRRDRTTIFFGKCMEVYSKYYPEVIEGRRQIDVLEALESVREMAESLPERETS